MTIAVLYVSNFNPVVKFKDVEDIAFEYIKKIILFVNFESCCLTVVVVIG